MKKVFAACLCFFAASLAFAQSQSSLGQPATTAAAAQKSERLSADTPEITVFGNAFVAPKDWSSRAGRLETLGDT
jgi:hypothetical protein